MRNTGEGTAGTTAVLRWAGHPGTLLAVLLLAFNDRVAKHGWPGGLTGKLSDVAWMVVAPPVFALLPTAVLRLRGDRPAAVGIAFTAASFAFAKSTAAGAESASRLWSLTGVESRTVADRTDLLALPALMVSWWLWRHRPDRRLLALLTVPLAVTAMVATSASEADVAGRRPRLVSEAGQPVMFLHHQRWTTADGGLTWRASASAARRRAPDPAPDPLAGVCLPEPAGLCFRMLDPFLPVEVSHNGRLTWQVDRRSPLTEGLAPRPGPPPAAPGAPAGVPMVVAAAPGGGYQVVVQCCGLLVRTVDGAWTTVALPPEPLPAALPADADPGIFRGQFVAWAAGWATILAGLAGLHLTRAGAARRARLGTLLAVRQTVALAWVPAASWLAGAGLVGPVPGLAIAGVLSLLLPALLALPLPEPGSPPGGLPQVLVSALGLVVGVVTSHDFLRWKAGEVSSWWAACRLAFGWTVAGIALGLALGFLLGRGTRRPPGRPAPRPVLPPPARPSRQQAGRHR
ncbi:hypothetical protein [Streptomyces sp. TLI_171]|uniref:hypothetical protein n=1 Tax=Streptomyces sp. TLI_171 TaxID=1938859 RepID=UPI000C372766|nr:hypothetical protein [Streptomyces sp. TLI_171]RKE22713.1 hypothetical protein BX266_6165 [Streptomyces sp. TLI_171]